MQTALVIPSLGGPQLESCIEAVAALEPTPDSVVAVLSGGATAPPTTRGVEIHRRTRRLGFAAAVNEGIRTLPTGVEAVAVLNDDAVPEPEWLGVLGAVLAADPGLAAVQGTSLDGTGSRIDGRGIELDRWGLPVQIDHGTALSSEHGTRAVVAVSGTACLFRMRALRDTAMSDLEVFDERFDCYHEDLDLGLRLTRMGWRSAWTGGARVRHLASATGPSFRWRHPWWILANRWRAFAGNLSRHALLLALARLYRGELRAVRTLLRRNPRAVPTAVGVSLALPYLIASGWRRRTSGERLANLPGGAA
jgi:GT2 family glycosyltransferase